MIHANPDPHSTALVTFTQKLNFLLFFQAKLVCCVTWRTRVRATPAILGHAATRTPCPGPTPATVPPASTAPTALRTSTSATKAIKAWFLIT